MGVLEAVAVADAVGLGPTVGVSVGVDVGVAVAVAVGVELGPKVGVGVGVLVGVADAGAPIWRLISIQLMLIHDTLSLVRKSVCVPPVESAQTVSRVT
jgi:hypothetical protein